MSRLRLHLPIAVLCLLVGVMVAAQFRTQRLLGRSDVPSSVTDQATYISQLYESTTELRQQANQLSSELNQYRSSDSTGKSNLDALVRDLQNIRMANGEVEATGPGVTVTADGDLTVFELQDLVNELRNASAEAIAVNGVRVVTRSAIVTDEAGRIIIDRQPVARPYRLEALGDPDTLQHALQRKGGLIALLQARDTALQITVTRHDTDKPTTWAKLPKTALDFTWVYSQAAP
ncbi:MAG: DUF881 domain-containing protein [Chloroflexia bacterium]